MGSDCSYTRVPAYLLVCKDQQGHLLQLWHGQNLVELLFGNRYPHTVCAVDDYDDSIHAFQVHPPRGPHVRLASQIPHLKVHVVHFDPFHIAAYGGYGRHCLPKAHLVQGGRLP